MLVKSSNLAGKKVEGQTRASILVGADRAMPSQFLASQVPAPPEEAFFVRLPSCSIFSSFSRPANSESKVRRMIAFFGKAYLSYLTFATVQSDTTVTHGTIRTVQYVASCASALDRLLSATRFSCLGFGRLPVRSRYPTLKG